MQERSKKDQINIKDEKSVNLISSEIIDAAVATKQLETKMEKVICNDKENEVVKDESEESWAVHSISFPRSLIRITEAATKISLTVASI